MTALAGGSEASSLDVAVAEFLDAYELKDEKTLVEHHKDWPARRASQVDSFLAFGKKIQVLAGVGLLSEHLERNFPQHHDKAPPFVIQVSPKKKVVLSQDCKAGSLVFAPETVVVKTTKKGSENDGPSNERDVEVTFDPEDPTLRFWLAAPNEKDGLAPLWFVVSTPDDRLANMTWAKFQAQNLQAVDYMGETTLKPHMNRKLASKQPAASTDSDVKVKDTKVEIPCLVNKTDLPKGTELLFYRAPTAKRPRAPEALTIAKLQKMAEKNSST